MTAVQVIDISGKVSETSSIASPLQLCAIPQGPPPRLLSAIGQKLVRTNFQQNIKGMQNKTDLITTSTSDSFDSEPESDINRICPPALCCETPDNNFSSKHLSKESVSNKPKIKLSIKAAKKNPCQKSSTTTTTLTIDQSLPNISSNRLCSLFNSQSAFSRESSALHRLLINNTTSKLELGQPSSQSIKPQSSMLTLQEEFEPKDQLPENTATKNLLVLSSNVTMEITENRGVSRSRQSILVKEGRRISPDGKVTSPLKNSPSKRVTFCDNTLF